MLDKSLYEVDNSDVTIITKLCFITLFANWQNNRFFLLIRQFFLIPNRINEFMGSQTVWFVPLLLESVLPECNHYLAIYTLKKQFQPQDDWKQLHVFLSA
jgi:hypothetical protein